MTHEPNMQHTYVENVCKVRLPLPKEISGGKRVENVRNCDIFIEEHNLLIYADVQLFQLHSPRPIDTKDIKNLLVKFNTKERCYTLQLRCLPQTEEEVLEIQHAEKCDAEKLHNSTLDLWKLKRITEQCLLQLDNSVELLKFEANFEYGFAKQFKGKLHSNGDCELTAICRVPQPHLISPLQRSIDREIDELRDFSREQYKLNFVELQVPEGHDNPMKFAINFDDNKLTKEEECLLHNFTRKPEDLHLPDVFDQTEIDCGLISILLGICYDIRSTSNDSTCESAWTRSILSATLSYFEPFDSLKELVISFLRRSLVYPLYRNYDLSRLCVQDVIDALQKSPVWILKQLLATHELFSSSDPNRDVFNCHFIEDYIRYVNNDAHCSATHLQTLARNLKNVLFDVYKKHLRLDLCEIEKELLKELISDIHFDNTSEDESETDHDDDNEDACTESGGDETETSSASETEENSVIEQRMDALQI